MPFRDVRGTLPLLAYRHKLMEGFFPLCSLLLSPKSDTKNSCTFTIEMLLRGFELSNLRTYMSISARTHAHTQTRARARTHIFLTASDTCISTSAQPGTILQLYHTHYYLHICTPRHNFTVVSHTLVTPHLHTHAQLYSCITHPHLHIQTKSLGVSNTTVIPHL